MPFYPYGLERNDGVHRMGMTDWHKHLIVGTALSGADEMPPPNPFLPSETSAPYYYGFQLLGASIQRAAGHTADIFPILLVLTLLIAAAT